MSTILEDVEGMSPDDQCFALVRELSASTKAETAKSIKANIFTLLAQHLPPINKFLHALASCSRGPVWKRTFAAEIAEYAVVNDYTDENPVSAGLARIFKRFARSPVGGYSFFSAGIRTITCAVAVVLLCPFWPFGLTYKVMMASLKHFRIARCGATFRAADAIESLSYGLEALVYWLLVCAFFVLSIPLFLLIFLTEITDLAIEEKQ